MSTAANIDINIRAGTGNLDAAVGKATGRLGQLRSSVNEQAGAIDTRLGSIGSSISDKFQQALTSPISALKSLASTMGNVLLHPIQSIKNAASGLISTFHNVGSAILGSIGIAQKLAPKIAAPTIPQLDIKPITIKLSELKRSTIRDADAIDKRLQAVGGGVGSKLDTKPITGKLASLKSSVSTQAGAIDKRLGGIGGSVGGKVTGAMQSVQNAFSGLVSSASSAGASGGSALAAGLAGPLLAFASTGIGAIVLAVAAIAASVVGIGLAFVGLAAKEAPVIAQAKKLADTLGMSSSKLLEMQGVFGDFDTAATTMEHLERTASEAALHGGEVAATLNRIGLNAREFAAMSADKKLEALDKALESIPDQGQKIAIAMQLGGKGAADLARTLGTGTGKLAEMRQKAIDLGLVISDSQAAAVQKSEKAWGNIGKALSGIGRQAAVMLAPMYEWIGNVVSKALSWVAQLLVKAQPYVAAFYASVASAWDTVVAAFTMVGEILAPVWGWIKAVWNDVVSGITQAWNNFTNTLGNSNIGGFFAPIKAMFSEVVGFFSNEDIFQGWGNAFQRVMLVLEFGFKNWKEIGSIAIDGVKLAFLGMTRDLNNAFVRVVDYMASGLNKIIDTINSINEKFGGIQFNRITAGQQQGQSQQERDLAQSIAQRTDSLGDAFRAFVQSRIQAVDAGVQQVRQQIDDIPHKYSQFAGAAEEGSKEAFSIIAGDRGDKALRVANDQLLTLRRIQEGLANNRNIGVVNLQAANL